MNKEIICKPIGVIHCEHTDPHKTPIQPVFAEGFTGQAEIFHNYEKGLQDIEGFSHIMILYYFHKATTQRLTLKPFLENVEHGVFATCAPNRPNHIDILDGSPILDIKPYVSRFNNCKDIRNGWQENIDEQTAYKLGRRIQR